MTSTELRQKFLEFFQEKGHAVIPSASLLPENDPTVLFTTAGMYPLIPYLLGEKHPEGKRLTDVQKCFRTTDIDEVGDKVHHTFFEMLGNWSLGDYFKNEAIEWSYEFLTSEKWLGIPKEKLAFTVFTGDEVPFDDESYQKWLSLGVSEKRIAKLGRKDNWWEPGEKGPAGPDSEMFYWTGEEEAPEVYDPEDKRWVEIWNDVFMQYQKLGEGQYVPLSRKNVDTGMGLERTLAVLSGIDDNYRTELFWPIIEKLEEISGKSYEGNEKAFRVIADHVKAATFAIGDGAVPSNKDRGYVVRRLIRRGIVKAHQLGVAANFTAELAKVVFGIYDGVYFGNHSERSEESLQRISHGDPSVAPWDDKERRILEELEKEETKFRRTLNNALRMIDSYTELDGKTLFDLYQSFGLPLEISLEEAGSRGITVNNLAIEQFNTLLREHQELSRTASAGMFKGGLADAGDMAVKYHTATHLLHAALRKVLGEHVQQKGSNITAERLRFDFSHQEKMTPEQIKEVEDIVNEQIQKDLLVSCEEVSPEEAKNSGALGFFEHKYGDIVKVYSIGAPNTPGGELFSKEICGGPHVIHTGELGHFKIAKEEASSAGIRRIKAVLE